MTNYRPSRTGSCPQLIRGHDNRGHHKLLVSTEFYVTTAGTEYICDHGRRRYQCKLCSGKNGRSTAAIARSAHQMRYRSATASTRPNHFFKVPALAFMYVTFMYMR